jgi:hypothetical protein
MAGGGACTGFALTVKKDIELVKICQKRYANALMVL